MNHINNLVKNGFIQPKNGYMISLHPMLQEITVTDTRPSVTNCRTMMDYQRKEIFYYHGIDVPYFKLLFATVLNIMEILEIDDKESYLRYLEDAFTCMDKYHFEGGMKKIVVEIEYLLKDISVGKAEARALLLDYQAALAEQFKHQTAKTIKLEQEALALLPEITADNALLASNLHANMGALYHTILSKLEITLCDFKFHSCLFISQLELLNWYPSFEVAICGLKKIISSHLSALNNNLLKSSYFLHIPAISQI